MWLRTIRLGIQILSGGPVGGHMWWIIADRDSGCIGSYFVKAEPPCNKGELRIAFWGLRLILGWEKNNA